MDGLSKFSKTYDETPDFSCNPLKLTPIPQGILGLSKNGKIRLLCHFLEKEPGIASITSIASPNGEYEAGEHLFRFIENTGKLSIDEEEIQSQSKWAMAFRFRDKWDN